MKPLQILLVLKRSLSSLGKYTCKEVLCEPGFSILVTIKIKMHNQLDVQLDKHAALLKTASLFNVLNQAKQQ